MLAVATFQDGLHIVQGYVDHGIHGGVRVEPDMRRDLDVGQGLEGLQTRVVDPRRAQVVLEDSGLAFDGIDARPGDRFPLKGRNQGPGVQQWDPWPH